MAIGEVISLCGLIIKIKTYLSVIETRENLKYENLVIAYDYLDDAVKALKVESAIMYINLAMDNYTKALLSKDALIKFRANYGIAMCNDFINEEAIAIKYLKRCLEIENKLYNKYVLKRNLTKHLSNEAQQSGLIKGMLCGGAAGAVAAFNMLDVMRFRWMVMITHKICHQYPNIKERNNQGSCEIRWGSVFNDLLHCY